MWYLFYLVRSLDIAYYLTAMMMGIGSYLVLTQLQVGRKKSAAAGLLVAYVFLVMSVTVLSRGHVKEETVYLVPFWSYIEILRGSPETYSLATEIVLNILMLVPVGFLLPVLVKRHAVLYGILVSVCIEVFQLITGRGYFEVNDLIHNSLGIVLGYGIYRLARRIVGSF